MNSVDENMLSHTKQSNTPNFSSESSQLPKSSGPLHDPVFSFSTRVVLTSDPYLPPKLYELPGVL